MKQILTILICTILLGATFLMMDSDEADNSVVRDVFYSDSDENETSEDNGTTDENETSEDNGSEDDSGDSGDSGNESSDDDGDETESDDSWSVVEMVYTVANFGVVLLGILGMGFLFAIYILMLIPIGIGMYFFGWTWY